MLNELLENWQVEISLADVCVTTANLHFFLYSFFYELLNNLVTF